MEMVVQNDKIYMNLWSHMWNDLYELLFYLCIKY